MRRELRPGKPVEAAPASAQRNESDARALPVLKNEPVPSHLLLHAYFFGISTRSPAFRFTIADDDNAGRWASLYSSSVIVAGIVHQFPVSVLTQLLIAPRFSCVNELLPRGVGCYVGLQTGAIRVF